MAQGLGVHQGAGGGRTRAETFSRALLAAAVSAWLLATPASASPPGWSTASLPMDRAAFAELVGLDPSLPRTLLLPQAIRRLHDDDLRGGGLRARVAAALTTSSSASTAVPLPLDETTWCRHVLDRCRPGVVAALLAEPRGGLMYLGLANLDAETRTALGQLPRLLSWIAHNRPGALAAFGDAIRVRNGRVVVPGDPGAERTWTELAGAPPGDVEVFVRALLAAGSGRLAYLYDTITHLDPARQRFALGASAQSAAAIAATFASIDDRWDVEVHPFIRAAVDATTLLLRVQVDADGQFVGPRSRAFWTRALDATAEDGSGADASGLAAGHDVDAAWLAERVAGRDARQRLASVQAVLYGQRAYPRADPATASDAAEAIRGVLRMPALVLTLERIGVTEPARVAGLVRCARALTAVTDPAARRLVLTEWQSAVALVARLESVGSVSGEQAGNLLADLAALRPDGGRFEDRLGRWMTMSLAPALAPLSSTVASSVPPEAPSIEATLLDALAGPRPRHPDRVTWEGTDYVLDEAEAERARLADIRARQNSQGLDAALGAFSLAAALVEPARVEADRFADLRGGLPGSTTRAGADVDVATVLARLERAHENGWRDRRAVARDRLALVEAAEGLLAESLRRLVYACALGSPDDRVFLAGDVSARHEFGADRPGMPPGPSPPWAFGTEQASGGQPWHVQGSIIGLDVALGRLRLRRPLGSMPTHQAVVSAAERSALVQTMTLTPARIEDTDARAIVSAIDRGRIRLAATGSDDEWQAVCRDAGFCGWRAGLSAWARAEEPDAALATASLAELAWAGRPPDASLPDAWGTASIVDGELAVRMPRPWPIELVAGRPTLAHGLTQFAELKQRLAEMLVERTLPASLTRSLVAAALQDFIDEVQPVVPDDWLTYVRTAQALSAERMDDYVAALAVPGGPLIPVHRSGEAP
jgi:hypothetical protein